MDTWLTSKELMERWKVNAPTLAAYVFNKSLHAKYTKQPRSTSVGERYPGGTLRQMQEWCDLYGRPVALGAILRSLDDFIFRTDDVIEFENKHKIVAKVEGKKEQAAGTRQKYPLPRGLSEKERALKMFAEKHPTLTTPMIIKKWIASKPDCMYDADRKIQRGFTQGTLEKTLNRLRKSAK